MNKNKEDKQNKYNKEIKILQNITTTLQQHKTETFQEQITLYGTINYTRTQYLTQLSKKITAQEEIPNTFYNYTSTESMILDLLNIIESQTIKTIETQKQDTTQKIILTITLLKILELTLKNHTKQEKQEKITQKINNIQNEYYTQIYNEKSDIRIK